MSSCHVNCPTNHTVGYLNWHFHLSYKWEFFIFFLSMPFPLTSIKSIHSNCLFRTNASASFGHLWLLVYVYFISKSYWLSLKHMQTNPGKRSPGLQPHLSSRLGSVPFLVTPETLWLLYVASQLSIAQKPDRSSQNGRINLRSSTNHSHCFHDPVFAPSVHCFSLAR